MSVTGWTTRRLGPFVAGPTCFFILLPLWFAASWAFAGSHDWTREAMTGELTLLFDWALFVPALYVVLAARAAASHRSSPG